MLTSESALRKDLAAGSPTFQHRHFAAVAAILRAELEHAACGQDQRDMMHSVAEAFARSLARTNPRFDRTRFLKACGVL